jgi:hypothetical protein
MSVRRTNRFWSVSLEHTLFLDFLKLFVNMRLAVSFVGKKTHFLNIRIKSYGCLKFQGEVWVGRACAAANQKELTTLKKIWGQGGWAKGAGGQNRGAPVQGRSPTASRWPGGRPWPTAGGDQRSPASCGSRLHRQVRRFFFKKIEIFLNFFFKALVCSKGLDFLAGGGGVGA